MDPRVTTAGPQPRSLLPARAAHKGPNATAVLLLPREAAYIASVKARGSAACSDGEHRAGRAPDHFLRHAAHQSVRQPSAAVGAHD
jgi:hypothetical protein